MSDPVATIKSELTWIQKHERILIVLLVLLAGAWGYNRYVNYAAGKDHTTASVAAQQLQDQKDFNKQNNTNSQQAATVYQQTITALTQQNAQLAAAISARNKTLTDQQGKNNTAPLQDVAKRWSMLTGIADTDITASASGVTVTDAGARVTVNTLENVPVLQANLKDTQTSCRNTQTELDKANNVIGTLNTQVTGLNTQILEQDNTCKKQLAQAASDARKGKLKWFKAGVVTGFLGGLFLGHKIP